MLPGKVGGWIAARADTMKAQPAAASIFCLCLVLAASAASAAEGLGKGQTYVLFGVPSPLLSGCAGTGRGCVGLW